MDLKKFLPGQDKKSSYEYYWSLVIEPGWVQAGIWRIQNEKAQIIFTSNASPWELDEELVSATDAALSSAIQNFPKEVPEPTKTVFGVSATWVKEGEITEEYLDKLKSLCSDLSLNPIGFVVLPEAIAHLIKSEEGSPLNAIVLGVYSRVLEVSVFRLGNLAGTTQVARSVSMEDDVSEGLSRFGGVDAFPSRFIIYDGKEGDLEDSRQNLLKVNWEDFEKIKFLHTPKVEIIDSKRKVNAVSLAGASELAEIKSIESPKEEGNTEPQVETESNITESSDVDPEKFGFVVDHDVANDVKISVESAQKMPIEHEEDGKAFQDTTDMQKEEIPKGTDKGRFSSPSSFGSRQNFLGLFHWLPSTLSVFSGGKKIFVIGAFVFLLLTLMGGFFWWFYPKAVVTVYVSPKRLEERINLNISISGEGDITGEIASTKIAGERTRDTTGTKTVGEKSKGVVTLYRVGTELSLDSGTVINGPENLKFTLDSDINVASGSASTPGTTTVAVTANEIGSQYNLATGTSFTVSNYSSADIEAKNENSFSGGTSREINAVSSEDLEILEEQLTNELKKEAASEILVNVPEDKIFIEESLTVVPIRIAFSNKEGDEATTLKLNLELEAEGVMVSRSEFMNLAKSTLMDKVPEGFVLRDDQVDFIFEFREKVDEVYRFVVRADVNLLPEVNMESVAKSVSGKYPDLAEEFLTREVPGFVRAEIKLTPALPGRLGTLPRVAKNIEVEVAAEK